MQRLVVSALGLHASCHHLFECKLNSCLDHGHHKDGVVKVLLLFDLHATSRGLLEVGLGSFLSPLQKVDVVVVPVLHHRLGKVPCNDVVLVLHVQRTHDLLQLCSQFVAFELRWVVQAIHHASDATVLQGLGDSLPAVLNELRGIARVNALLDHLVEGKDGTCLQHTTKDCLLTHKIALHLCHKGAQKHTCAVPTCGCGISLCNVQADALRIVLRMHSDQSGHSKAALVLLSNLSSWALWCHHHHREVITDLHALLDNVEAMTVSESGALLHQRHHCTDD
mmetsp:Transcript_3564/g.6278  ORF Transcript_3564/g.6278 Transcript_3564/m.6278 type:complete len:280 (+) Transcript_3564:503-1342(+)